MKRKPKHWTERKAKKEELQVCYEALEDWNPASEEYAMILKRIEDIHKSDNKVDANTIASGAFSVGSILVILFYEGAGNIVKTKALNFISKIHL